MPAHGLVPRSLATSALATFALATFALLLGLSTGLSCGEEEDPGEDPDKVLATSIAYESELERLDVDLVLSQHLDGLSKASIWANADAAALFRTLDPADSYQTATFPRGALLVKDIHDLEGNPLDALTVMAKFEPGYFPEGNDWYFAMIARDGTILEEAAGNGPEVKFCVDCHAMMGPNTDMIIGLPPDMLR